MISGVKRKKTAIETTFRFFQTIDLLISHFKREADKEKIFELTTKNTTLEGILIATAAVHLYHNLGIRVKDTLKKDVTSVESTRKLEFAEKSLLLEELNSLLKDSFNLETELLFKKIDIENKFLELLLKEREPDLQNLQKEELIKSIDMYLEEELLEMVRSYPLFCFYDLISDLLGLTNDIKSMILDESASMKEISIEIEEKLKRKEKEDKYIELSTLNRLQQKIQEEYEFHSHKELQTQAMPVRMLKRKIFTYHLEKYPISIHGLKAHITGNELRKELISRIKEVLFTNINYDEFEQAMLKFLIENFTEKLKATPNDFIYFLQALSERDFSDIIFTLNKFGIYNISQMMNMNEDLSRQVNQNMIRYNINKFDIMNLNDPKKNQIYLVKKVIYELDLPALKKSLNINDTITDLDFEKLLNQDNTDHQTLWNLIQKKIQLEKNEIREAFRKKKIIDNIFLEKLKLKNYSQILLLLNFSDILENISKEIFYLILSKILRQLSRIIELYVKITNDKALYLLGLKKISGLTETEDWVKIKLEELLINRVFERQKELIIVLNADNKPFLVNGFILSRLIDIPLKASMAELQNVPSPLYEGIKPITLQAEFISPSSYCMAYDLIKRFETFEGKRKKEVEKIVEKEVEKKEQKKVEIRKLQQESAFNWIERRITSSLMRINSPGINPTLLYWQENDTKIASDNIKLFSEKDGNSLDLFLEYFFFVLDKLEIHAPDVDFPNEETVTTFTENVVKNVISQRINHAPNSTEINNMLEGERFEISKQLAKKIGDYLNKALYTKFKNKKR